MKSADAFVQDPSAPPDVLQTHQLGVVYRRGGLWNPGPTVHALHGIDLRIAAGEIVGIVGPSGSGKSTLARCLALQESPHQGRREVLGVDPWRRTAGDLRRLRPKVQLVHQSPAAALDPRFSVERVLTQPLRYRPGPRLSARARADHVRDLLRTVDLDPDLATRPCHALSGGQKQRLVLARALAAEPRVLIFDEPLAALDAHQHQRLLQLLRDLHRLRDLTYVWISHDLHTVVDFAQRIVVLSGGQIVERGTARRLWQQPQHAVSRGLVEASRIMLPSTEAASHPGSAL